MLRHCQMSDTFQINGIISCGKPTCCLCKKLLAFFFILTSCCSIQSFDFSTYASLTKQWWQWHILILGRSKDWEKVAPEELITLGRTSMSKETSWDCLEQTFGATPSSELLVVRYVLLGGVCLWAASSSSFSSFVCYC